MCIPLPPPRPRSPIDIGYRPKTCSAVPSSTLEARAAGSPYPIHHPSSAQLPAPKTIHRLSRAHVLSATIVPVQTKVSTFGSCGGWMRGSTSRVGRQCHPTALRAVPIASRSRPFFALPCLTIASLGTYLPCPLEPKLRHPTSRPPAAFHPPDALPLTSPPSNLLLRSSSCPPSYASRR